MFFVDIILGVSVVVVTFVFILYFRSVTKPKLAREPKKEDNRQPQKESGFFVESEPTTIQQPKSAGFEPAKKIRRLSFSWPKLGVTKIQIPGLRTGKRILAFVALCFNFFVGQTALMGAQRTQPFYLFFMLNSFLLVDYLWKTRKIAVKRDEAKQWR